MNKKLTFISFLFSVSFPVMVVAELVAIKHDLSVDPVETVAMLDSLDKKKPLVSKLQANITRHTLVELKELLERAESIANGEALYRTDEPIAVILHGEEIHAFLRSNYRTNKSLVDLAARLDAFNVIDVKVCERWMGANGIMAKDLPPFVEPVPFGVREVGRLKEAGYAYF